MDQILVGVLAVAFVLGFPLLAYGWYEGRERRRQRSLGTRRKKKIRL